MHSGESRGLEGLIRAPLFYQDSTQNLVDVDKIEPPNLPALSS